jgi:hypothetical protein
VLLCGQISKCSTLTKVDRASTVFATKSMSLNIESTGRHIKRTEDETERETHSNIEKERKKEGQRNKVRQRDKVSETWKERKRKSYRGRRA